MFRADPEKFPKPEKKFHFNAKKWIAEEVRYIEKVKHLRPKQSVLKLKRLPCQVCGQTHIGYDGFVFKGKKYKKRSIKPEEKVQAHLLHCAAPGDYERTKEQHKVKLEELIQRYSGKTDESPEQSLEPPDPIGAEIILSLIANNTERDGHGYAHYNSLPVKVKEFLNCLPKQT